MSIRERLADWAEYMADRADAAPMRTRIQLCWDILTMTDNETLSQLADTRRYLFLIDQARLNGRIDTLREVQAIARREPTTADFEYAVGPLVHRAETARKYRRALFDRKTA